MDAPDVPRRTTIPDAARFLGLAAAAAGLRARGRRRARRPRAEARAAAGPAPDPGRDGPGPRRGVHGARRSAPSTPDRIRRRPAPAGARQQRELRGGVAAPASARPEHEPRVASWMYLERVPLVVVRARARRAVATPRSACRSPTSLRRSRSSIGFEAWPRDREGDAPLPRTTVSRPLRGRPDRRHVRDRRRRMERPAGVARGLAQPQAPDGRGRELPQRDHRLVPRGDRLRARDDRHRERTRARTASPGTTSARRRASARPTARPATPTPPTSWSRPSPTCTATPPATAPGSASSGTRSGTSGCSASAAAIATGRRAARRRVLGRGRRPHWTPAQPATCTGCRRRRPRLDRLEAHRAAFTPRRRSRTTPTPTAPKADCCTPPIIRYQGDLIEATLRLRADRRGRRPSLLLHQLQGARLRGAPLQHVRPDDEATRSARSTRSSGGWSRMLEDRFGPGGFALIVTADHGQCPLPDDVGGTRVDPVELGRTSSASSTAALFEPRAERRARRRSTCTRDALGSSASRAATSPRSSATTATARTSGRTSTRRDRARPAGSATVRRRVRDEFLDTLADRDLSTFGPGIFAEAEIGIPAPIL